MPGRRIAARCASWCSGRSAGRPSGRKAGGRRCSGWAKTSRSCLSLFGQPRGPEPARARTSGRARGRRSSVAGSRAVVFGRRGEWPALLERAPLDLRVNPRGQRAANCSASFEAEPTPLSPWGIRLPPDSRVRDHPAFADGLVEVQDEGSQLIVLACEPAHGRGDRSTYAPGPAARRLRWLQRFRGATILATDSNRARLSKIAAARRARWGDDRERAC